jgi:hypothetical protein
MSREVSSMAATRKEITELMQEHDAVRAHMRFLTNSLSNLAAQSSQGTAQSTVLKDQIVPYLWRLYDFRVAVRRHIDVDERVFETLLDTSVKDKRGEHKAIQKQMDDAIRLAENAVYNRLRRNEMKKCVTDLGKAVNAMCELIGAHMAGEDRLLKQVQKES